MYIGPFVGRFAPIVILQWRVGVMMLMKKGGWPAIAATLKTFNTKCTKQTTAISLAPIWEVARHR